MEKPDQATRPPRILLGLLPFWTPWIPPAGIATLKAYLRQHGFDVTTVDATTEQSFKDSYQDYFNLLLTVIPLHHQGNFYNIGHDLLQNHLMAHLHREEEDEQRYIQLVKILVERIFYTPLPEETIQALDDMVATFYRRLQDWLATLMEAEQPTVFGLTVYCHTVPASLFAFRWVKEHYPRIRTVMGGGIFIEQLSAGSKNWDLFLEKTPYIDKILVGAGEQLFLKYLQGELPEQSRVLTTAMLAPEDSPPDAPVPLLPDYSDFDLRYYPALAASTSSGCPFQCAFCSQRVFFGPYRRKKVQTAAAEIAQLTKTYHFRMFSMIDALLNPVITEFSRELLDSGIDAYWEGCLRVGEQVVNIENTLLWRRAGFYKAMIGIECGSQRVLDLMGKGITPDQSRAALASLANAGIKTTTYWVIGFPGETEEDFQLTLDLLEAAQDDIYEAESHPFQYLTGQVRSPEWSRQEVSLYPEDATGMLVLKTFIVDCQPPREVIYQRLNRFVAHCRRLGIPNPYSTFDIHNADERWQQLHKNAVPPLVEILSSENCFRERDHIKKVYSSVKPEPDEGDFLF
jgi:hypothetical protein